jgi:hypothetical protein
LPPDAAGSVVDPADIVGPLVARRTSRPELFPRGFAEPTASIVWGCVRELGLPPREVVPWNAFAWHPYDPRAGLLSNRMPTGAELEHGLAALAAFIDLVPHARFVAVGRLAAATLARLGVGAALVRHPASGGAALFRAQLAQIVRAR